MRIVVVIRLCLVIIKAFIISLYPHSFFPKPSAVIGKHSNRFTVYIFECVLIKCVQFCIHILIYRNGSSQSVLHCSIPFTPRTSINDF